MKKDYWEDQMDGIEWGGIVTMLVVLLAIILIFKWWAIPIIIIASWLRGLS